MGKSTQIIKKVLSSLPKPWEPKVTAIEESKDLNTLQLDELLGSLITYELKQKHNEEKDEAIKVDVKKKGVALKSTQVEVEDESSEEIDEDIAMLSRCIQRFMKRRSGNQGKKRSFRRGDDQKGHIICLLGHQKARILGPKLIYFALFLHKLRAYLLKL